MDLILAFVGIACLVVLLVILLVKHRLSQIYNKKWEYRYKEVVEKASDMILLLNEKGEIIESNAAAARIFNLKSERSLLGKQFFSLIVDSDGNDVNWEQFLRNLMATRYTLEDFLNSNRLLCGVKSDACDNYLDIVISEAQDRDYGIWSVFARDVTEQEQLAREKADLSEQLHHAQRLESVGKLAGGVAHDFNNYLHAMQGHLDLIKYMYTIEDEDVIRHLDKIAEITGMASELTRQLLGFARKGKYRETVFDINKLLDDTTDLFMPNNYEGLDFELSKDETLHKVKGDFVQLQQVLLSILINGQYALESNGDNANSMTVRSMLSSEVEVLLNPPKDIVLVGTYYSIVVEDTGVGIDKAVLQRIFEPFFTTKRFGEGTGMGLSMAYGIVLNHHGWIQVDSEVGVGTKVYIFLPAFNEEKKVVKSEEKQAQREIAS